MKALPLINVVYFGDSITFGQYVDAADRWTTLVDEELDGIYKDTAIHIQTLNRGVSGETTRMGLNRFANDVQAIQPDIVTIQFGMNDCNCWFTDRGLPRTSERAYQANMAEMIERARHFGASHVILATNHRSMKRKAMLSGEPFEDASRRYNELARGVVKETGAILSDVELAFDPFDDSQLEKLLLPYPDCLHLSVEGHRVYAGVVRDPILAAVAELAAERGA